MLSEHETKVIDDARKLGVLDETKSRNLQIKNAFRSMRANGMKYEVCVQKLSMQFCLSESRIENIINQK